MKKNNLKFITLNIVAEYQCYIAKARCLLTFMMSFDLKLLDCKISYKVWIVLIWEALLSFINKIVETIINTITNETVDEIDTSVAGTYQISYAVTYKNKTVIFNWWT